MYGFKPKSARGKTVPQLADGENVKPRGFKPGGLIRGPGTGTSDSIETEKRPGTFIMPADSTQAIGPEALEELGEVDDSAVEEQGEKVPVRLSNGEFELPPEQVQALGEAVLTVLRDTTHEQAEEDQNSMPKAAGFMPCQFFANGGVVAPGRMDIGQWAQAQADADQYAVQQAQRQSFFNGGVVENNVTRDGNSYSGGNVGGIQTPATAMGASKPGAFGTQPASPYGFKPRGYAGGGTIKDDERAKLIQQIPAGSNMPAPSADGKDTTEFSRNVNNGLSALGGMGVVASVPLRAGQAAKAAATGSGATALPSGIPRLTGPAQAAAAPAADFVAGMGPGATTYANTIPRIGNAPTQALPAVNAALQEGAQANVMSAAMRTASGANAGATALDSTQRNNPAAAPSPSPATAPATAPAPAAATQSEYGRQMSAVGGALVDGAAWLGKTIVSAPGYGFNKPSAAPAPAGATATAGAGAGRGAINPARINPTQPAAASAPVVVQRMAQPPQSPAFDFDNFQPAPGQGAFRNEQTGEVTRLQDGPAPIGTRTRKEPNVLPRSDARPAAQRQEVRAPVLNPNGGVFAAMADFTNQAGQAVQAIAANKGMRNDRKDDLDQTRVDADIAATGARLSLDGQRVGLDAQRVAQGGESNRIAGEELSMRREAAGFQTRAAAQQERLRNVLLDPKSTPEQRAEARRGLAAFRDKTAADRMQTVALPDTTNEMGLVVRGGQALVRVLEDGSVQQVPIGAQQGAALPPGMKRQIGTSNGRPVYEDMNGKKVIAKG